MKIRVKDNKTIRTKNASHFMLRDYIYNNIVELDLFILEFTFYKLITRKTLYKD